MPIYEYRCNNCHRRVSIFVQGIPQSLNPACPQCGSEDITRIFSSFIMGKSDWYKRKGVYNDILWDSKLTRGMRAGDPRALAEWNRRIGQATEEKPGPEFEEILGRMEKGEPVEQVMRKAGYGREEGQGEGKE